MAYPKYTDLQIFGQASPVEFNPTSPTEVAISTYIETGVTEEGNVVAPGWIRKIDRFWTGKVPCQEGTTDTESTSPRDALSHRNLRYVSERVT